MKQAFLLLCSIILFNPLFGQFSHEGKFTIADSLRGGYGDARDWWNLVHYDLSVSFDIPGKQISGRNRITYRPTGPQGKLSLSDTDDKLQIDLQEPMKLDSIVFLDKEGKRSGSTLGTGLLKIGYSYFIEHHSELYDKNGNYTVDVYFHGSPKEAKKAPWDGGILWKKDPNGKPWVTVACQGLGASIWFPCKDSQRDEPDNGVTMHYTCPADLMCVSNGHFAGKKELGNGMATYTWEVENPINNYCMIPYIGDYVNMHEHVDGEKGVLEMDYWVIRGNEEKAKKQFADAPRTINALEYWFGPYPFYEDGYKLVEAPHLGMEHQSAVAYGNGYQNGYMGSDLSGTGQGLKWDFIIVHESGHEWYGNNITSKDIADMWIHEGFTNYSETLFMDYWFGTEAANEYARGLRKAIRNDEPVIGPYGVNTEGSGDMYFKASNMLHTIRQVVGNDSIFRFMLREMNHKYYHQTVTTQEIEQFMSDYLKLDLSKVFDQYLREKDPPTLEINIKKGKVRCRWVNCVDGFNLPVKLTDGQIISPGGSWLRIDSKENKPGVDQNYYILIEYSGGKKQKPAKAPTRRGL